MKHQRKETPTASSHVVTIPARPPPRIRHRHRLRSSSTTCEPPRPPQSATSPPIRRGAACFKCTRRGYCEGICGLARGTSGGMGYGREMGDERRVGEARQTNWERERKKGRGSEGGHVNDKTGNGGRGRGRLRTVDASQASVCSTIECTPSLFCHLVPAIDAI